MDLRPEQAGRPGFCNITEADEDSHGACVASRRLRELRAAPAVQGAWSVWRLGECVSLCVQCTACRYVSFSARFRVRAWAPTTQ